MPYTKSLSLHIIMNNQILSVVPDGPSILSKVHLATLGVHKSCLKIIVLIMKKCFCSAFANCVHSYRLNILQVVVMAELWSGPSIWMTSRANVPIQGKTGFLLLQKLRMF